MTRFNPAMTSAAAGEISPRLDGRDNLDQYFESLRECENFIVTLQGGLLRRSGTLNVAEAKFPTANVRLIPFTVSTEQTFLLELGATFMRVYLDDEQFLMSDITTPYGGPQIDEVRVAQEANRMYFVHPSHPTYVLTRPTPTTFDFSPVTYRRGRAPMMPPNTDENVTFEISGAGPTTFTLTTVGFRDLVASDVGRYIRVGDGSTKHLFYKIATIADTDEATVTLINTLQTPTTGAQTDWSISPISDTLGFYTVQFHEGRLFYGGTPEAVDRLWASNSDDFDFFDPINFDLADRQADEEDRSFTRRLVSGQVNRIRWMLSTERTLFIGTSSAEFSLEPDNDSILSNVSARVRPTTAVGSASVEPVVANDTAIFVQKDTEKLRRVSYSLVDDRQRAQDMSILAEHLTRAGVFQIVYQQSPESILWAVLVDGSLVAVTLEQEQRIVAFHRHRLGGQYRGRAPFVVSAAVVPSNTRDDLYLAVRRTNISGEEVTTIEKLAPLFRPAVGPRASEAERLDAVRSAYFLDAGVQRRDATTDITNITAAFPPVVTTASNHSFNPGDKVKFLGLPGMPSLNGKVFTVASSTFTTFTLEGVSTILETFYPGATALKGFTTITSPLLTQFTSGVSFAPGGGFGGDLAASLQASVSALQAFADGAPAYGVVLDDDTVTFPDTVFEASVGLPFISYAETQRFTGGSRLGTGQALPTRTNRIDVRVLHTVGLNIAASNRANPDSPEFRETAYLMDEALPLFSGDVSVSPESEWTDLPTVTIVQDKPLPAHILSVYPRNTSNDR